VSVAAPAVTGDWEGFLRDVSAGPMNDVTTRMHDGNAVDDVVRGPAHMMHDAGAVERARLGLADRHRPGQDSEGCSSKQLGGGRQDGAQDAHEGGSGETGF
jgi:hypothetical protein